jgi:hypothetical protein
MPAAVAVPQGRQADFADTRIVLRHGLASCGHTVTFDAGLARLDHLRERRPRRNPSFNWRPSRDWVGAVPLRWAEVVALARGTAELLVDEVLDWRAIFLDRPPALPA